MAYDDKLAARIRKTLSEIENLIVEEKRMFRGIAFMVNGKMCLNVSNDELMCRINPDLQEDLAARNGCRPVIMRGKPAKGYIYVSQDVLEIQKDYDFWINLCLEFNRIAKPSKKKKLLKGRL